MKLKAFFPLVKSFDDYSFYEHKLQMSSIGNFNGTGNIGSGGLKLDSNLRSISITDNLETNIDGVRISFFIDDIQEPSSYANEINILTLTCGDAGNQDIIKLCITKNLRLSFSFNDNEITPVSWYDISSTHNFVVIDIRSNEENLEASINFIDWCDGDTPSKFPLTGFKNLNNKNITSITIGNDSNNYDFSISGLKVYSVDTSDILYTNHYVMNDNYYCEPLLNYTFNNMIVNKNSDNVIVSKYIPDSAELRNHAIVHGNQTVESISNSITMNHGYLNVPASSTIQYIKCIGDKFNFLQKNFELTFWVKISAYPYVSNPITLVSINYPESKTDYHLCIDIRADKKLHCAYKTTNYASAPAVNDTEIELNKWTAICLYIYENQIACNINNGTWKYTTYDHITLPDTENRYLYIGNLDETTQTTINEFQMSNFKLFISSFINNNYRAKLSLGLDGTLRTRDINITDAPNLFKEINMLGTTDVYDIEEVDTDKITVNTQNSKITAKEFVEW